MRVAHQVPFASSSSPERAPVLGCRGCAWIMKSWSRPHGTRHSRSQGRDTSSPALSAGPESSLGGPRLLRLRGRDTSPGHRDFRYRALALSFFFFFSSFNFRSFVYVGIKLISYVVFLCVFSILSLLYIYIEVFFVVVFF